MNDVEKRDGEGFVTQPVTGRDFHVSNPPNQAHFYFTGAIVLTMDQDNQAKTEPTTPGLPPNAIDIVTLVCSLLI